MIIASIKKNINAINITRGLIKSIKNFVYALAGKGHPRNESLPDICLMNGISKLKASNQDKYSFDFANGISITRVCTKNKIIFGLPVPGLCAVTCTNKKKPIEYTKYHNNCIGDLLDA